MNKTRIFTAAPLGSIPELPAMSCLEIKASEGNNTISGKYWLDPTGTGRAILIDYDIASLIFFTSYFYHKTTLI